MAMRAFKLMGSLQTIHSVIS